MYLLHPRAFVWLEIPLGSPTFAISSDTHYLIFFFFLLATTAASGASIYSASGAMAEIALDLPLCFCSTLMYSALHAAPVIFSFRRGPCTARLLLYTKEDTHLA